MTKFEDEWGCTATASNDVMTCSEINVFTIVASDMICYTWMDVEYPPHVCGATRFASVELLNTVLGKMCKIVVTLVSK